MKPQKYSWQQLEIRKISLRVGFAIPSQGTPSQPHHILMFSSENVRITPLSLHFSPPQRKQTLAKQKNQGLLISVASSAQLKVPRELPTPYSTSSFRYS
jgi:hypothetical protein